MSQNYKETLLMPKTSFNMRAQLQSSEPYFLKYWKDQKILEKTYSSGTKTFLFHDGPPYANGGIHMGHTLNKILKDIVIRFKAMTNHKIEYQFVWDTHGLPIEIALQKKGITLQNYSLQQYLNCCKEYALAQVQIQKQQLSKLLLLAPFDKELLTLTSKWESQQIEVFYEMLKKGLIYRSLKPVYWSWSTQTALAETEIEYYEKESPSIYVAFSLKSKQDFVVEDIKAVIWTTTPWTLNGNVGISINKKYYYGVYKTKFGNLLLATELSTKLFKEWNCKGKLIQKFKGEQLEKLVFVNPLNGHDSLMMLGTHVTLESGTGLVHTAGGHGLDDFNVVNNYKLEIYSVLDEKGILNKRCNDLQGLFYLKADPLIIEKLQKNNSLIFYQNFKHQYPHDWRSKKPVFYRATKQWFVNVKKLSEEIISEIKKVQWIPSWGKEKMIKMMENRQDWCISRQRYWGVPIPIIYDDEKILNDDKLNQHFITLFKKHGSIIWHQKNLKDLLPKDIKYKSSMRKESDTLEVWFDSGTSWRMIDFKKQIDLYLEGNDQFRGWFNTSLITSIALNHQAPYKKVVTHGFVVDANGVKMSKSQGNGIDPQKIINQYGAEILRMWVASSDFKKEVAIGEDIIAQIAKDYIKIRNTFKFMLGVLDQFEFEKHQTKTFREIDTFILNKLIILNESVIKFYEQFEFNKIVSTIKNFINIDLSAFYIDCNKDTFYIKKENDKERRQAQTTIYYVLDTLLKILAPILPVLSEDAYQHFTSKFKSLTSIHLEMIKPLVLKPKAINEKKWKVFNEIKNLLLKQLEELKVQGKLTKSLHANVTFILPKEDINFFTSNDLQEWLMISQANLKIGKKLEIIIVKHSGFTCARCWKMFNDKDYDKVNEICLSCKKIINLKK